MLISATMSSTLYSIRMRASRCGEHISGAERIVRCEELDALSAVLTRRALAHPKGEPDDIRITIETVDPAAIVHLPLPDITTVVVADVASGRLAARQELLRAGVSATAVEQTMAALGSGCAMRGAMLVDAQSGARLEPDPLRGVRVSRMDLTAAAAAELHALLSPRGLDNPHVREALVLAAKVRATPGFVAELCWSDDPDYSAGYVSSPQRGYVRFPWLKPLGDPRGGRAFFVDCRHFDLAAALEWLERTPVLCDRVSAIHPDESPTT